MIVRIVAVGAVLPQPALGLGGRPEAPSPPVLASPGFDPSGALASIDEEPPEPPVPPPEPPEPPEPAAPVVAPPEPPLPDVVGPALVDEVELDVVGEPVLEPPEPPAPAVVVVAVELGVPGVDAESSEHAAAAAIEMPTRIEPRIVRMSGSCGAWKGTSLSMVRMAAAKEINSGKIVQDYVLPRGASSWPARLDDFAPNGLASDLNA